MVVLEPESGKFVLRPFEEDDIEQFYNYMDDEDVLRHMPSYPPTIYSGTCRGYVRELDKER